MEKRYARETKLGYIARLIVEIVRLRKALKAAEAALELEITTR